MTTHCVTLNGPTRREALEYGGAIVAGGLLAGCTGTGSDDDSSGDAADGGDDSYTVEMAPVGELEFDAPPERVTTYFPGYADMCVALGVEDSLVAMAELNRYYTRYYDELDGVSIEADGLTEILGDNGIDKELFYELESDLHLIDPEWLINNDFFKLEENDVEEIEQNVAPFFGTTIFRRTDEWHDYRYYSLYEAFETVAQVFQAEDRYEAFAAFHDEYVAEIETRLPPLDDRPTALLCYGDGDEPEEFSPYRLTDRGTNKKQWHDLGVEDALSGTGIDGLSTTDRGTVDYETMLEVDPDVLLIRGHEDKSAAEFEETVVSFVRDHDVASELTAVETDRVFRGGPIYQGPIQHLFTLERAAQDLYPEEFGDEELFDRDEVSEIVTGER